MLVRPKDETGTVCKWQRSPSPATDESQSQIRKAYGVQQERLAVVAHELRLPLSHIKGFVTSLQRSDVKWDDQTRSEFLAEIEVETDRLAQLVDSLLTHTPATDVAFTHPASVVHGALNRVRGSLRDRLLRVDVSPGLRSVWMNASDMERVLANLLQNAIKYSPPGTPIGVSARIAGGSELEFSVEDEGQGIPAEDRERIFEPFFRHATAKQSNVPGHGLGLAICQSIVLAHGGRIRVTDRPGGGARFSVFLPARARAAVHRSPISRPAATRRGTRIRAAVA